MQNISNHGELHAEHYLIQKTCYSPPWVHGFPPLDNFMSGKLVVMIGSYSENYRVMQWYTGGSPPQKWPFLYKEF